ncbi:hypothetical protein [Bacillus alveayuensis]|jgi:hypothetical protein|uniref:Branched-chain amino acid ABC transporter substrate-binding protein n=1 Tax=Aeribacillus alveayuensis TaxID=279215 RepID=A0ABT9VR60_9BACI|nr:hypothetical protein [Bacillus alveayuensis]MDQ0163456.1 hypothetical protein [Bacillus alveayuensis]
MMKKITDERLLIKNLKNIRIAFVIQSVGIIGILLYDAITKGITSMTHQPLWIVFMITSIVLGYLQMSISIDYENPSKKVKPSTYFKGLSAILGISIVIAFLVYLSPESGLKESNIVGIVLFLSMLAPYSYIYYLRKKKYEDEEDE